MKTGKSLIPIIGCLAVPKQVYFKFFHHFLICIHLLEYNHFYKLSLLQFFMLSYNDIYELLRKEKYSENLQQLPKNFVEDVSEYLNDRKGESSKNEDMFADSVLKSKKQLENSIAIFMELILRRKKKLLNLVFVAAETGIMKRDYENMLPFEKDVFDKLVKAFEAGDKDLARILNGKKDDLKERNKMVLFSQNVEQFVDMNGNLVGPFASGQLANLDMQVSDILVQGGKAQFVDDS